MTVYSVKFTEWMEYTVESMYWDFGSVQCAVCSGSVQSVICSVHLKASGLMDGLKKSGSFN